MRLLAYSFVVQLLVCALAALSTLLSRILRGARSLNAFAWLRCYQGPVRADDNMVLKDLYWHSRCSSEQHHPAHDNSGKRVRRTGPFTSFRAVSTGTRRASRCRGRSIGSGDTGTTAGGVRRAFAAIDAGEVRRDEGNALLPGALSRVRGRCRGIAVLPRALAGDTGAFIVPAEAHAARPAWPAEFRGQYTGIKTIGADLRIDVQRSYTRPGVCSRRPERPDSSCHIGYL